MITQSFVESLDDEVRTAGWLFQSSTPFTDSQRDLIVESLAGPGLLAATLSDDGSGLSVVEVLTVVGGALALAVLALSIALMTAESAGESRTLAAVGASRWTRRWVAGASTIWLSIGAALLALPMGFLGLVALPTDTSSDYPFEVPFTPVAILFLAVPAIAAAGSWLATN